MSSGEQLRDYLPVEEVARLIVSLALSKKGLGVINVCSGEPVSIRSLVQGWVRTFDETIKLNCGYYPIPDYEPTAFWGDRSKLGEFLGE
jgi:dTDP-6-deoxy-L-talose 4-dehydrogenase (NAD+)